MTEQKRAKNLELWRFWIGDDEKPTSVSVRTDDIYFIAGKDGKRAELLAGWWINRTDKQPILMAAAAQVVALLLREIPPGRARDVWRAGITVRAPNAFRFRFGAIESHPLDREQL